MMQSNGRDAGTQASNPPPTLPVWARKAALRLAGLGNQEGVHNITLIVTREEARGGRERMLVRRFVVEEMGRVETLGRG